MGLRSTEPYRPWELLEALKLTKGMVHDTGDLTSCLQLKLHDGGRILEDASAERVLGDMLQAGGQVINLLVTAAAKALPIFGSKVGVFCAISAGQ
eukprot:3498254-Pleurochrysis_carterae.AAC.1